MRRRRSPVRFLSVALALVGVCFTAPGCSAQVSELDKLRQGLQKPNERECVDAIQKWNGPEADAGKAAEILVGPWATRAFQFSRRPLRLWSRSAKKPPGPWGRPCRL